MMMAQRILVSLAALAVASADLKPASEMTTNCYDFPSTNFARENCIKNTYGKSPVAGGLLSVGDSAYDFTLYDVDGNAHTLSNLLADKPVALIWGMYTCPAYQGLGGDYPFDQCGYKEEYDMVEKYKDSITFVHLYGPEPHPTSPDTNFDSGIMRMNYWSTTRQPLTYDDRLTMAKKIVTNTHPDQLLLVDLFEGNPYDSDANQPVWCSMGLGARTAMLISQDGTLKFAQSWFRQEDFESAIEENFPQSSNN